MGASQAIILGLVQGLTEFIPVSSSGHLILARELLHLPVSGGLAFDAVLQLATGLAVVAYFIPEIPGIMRDRTLLLAIAVGTVPAVVFGLLLESAMETIFRSAELVGWTLLLGAALMGAAEKFGKENVRLSPARGGFIGLFQALALVPGISRSGATISGGLFMGLARADAARFSFLLSVPIILGSGAKKLLDLEFSGALAGVGTELLLASVVAFVSGYLAVKYLIKYLKHHSLAPFIIYRIALAALVFILL
jgi:undecaprenyl-diphosphatase